MKRRSRLRVAKKSVRVYGDQDHPNFGSVAAAAVLYFGDAVRRAKKAVNGRKLRRRHSWQIMQLSWTAYMHPDKNVRRRAKRALNKLLQKP